MTACQASRRGGIVGVEFCGDRVLLGGEAVIVAQGELLARWVTPSDTRQR
jgi:hypothetical protein